LRIVVKHLLNLPPGKVVALAQSELVGTVETGRARLACDCQLDIGHLVITRDLVAIVLMPSLGSWSFPRSRWRLMMMSGSGASTCTPGYGRAVTSRLTEVTATTVPAGHRQPGEPGQEDCRMDQAGCAWPQSNDVPSTQMQWRITAIFRAMATFAFFMPIRFASFIPQALREHHFFVR
jgi:hypothetical protein